MIFLVLAIICANKLYLTPVGIILSIAMIVKRFSDTIVKDYDDLILALLTLCAAFVPLHLIQLLPITPDNALDIPLMNWSKVVLMITSWYITYSTLRWTFRFARYKSLGNLQQYELYLIGLHIGSIWLWYQNAAHVAAYAWGLSLVLINLAWVSIYTDAKHMVISRFVSLYPIAPILLLAYLRPGILNLSWQESITTFCAAMLLLSIIKGLFKAIKGFDGLGQGDIELIGLIGATTGFIGLWFIMMTASASCTLFALWYKTYIDCTQKHFPFGSFLAGAWILFILFQTNITTYCSSYLVL